MSRLVEIRQGEGGDWYASIAGERLQLSRDARPDSRDLLAAAVGGCALRTIEPMMRRHGLEAGNISIDVHVLHGERLELRIRTDFHVPPVVRPLLEKAIARGPVGRLLGSAPRILWI
jgi:uncharacterized OsmC-like protein